MSFSTGSSSGSNGSDGPEWNLEEWLVGRERESEQIQEIVAAAQEQSQPATIIVHGKAGVGKTALISSVPSWKDYLVASGKYEHAKIQEPYGALIQALNNLVDLWLVQNSMQQVCQLGGFRLLLKEDYEFMRNILPKAYLAATNNGTCMCQVSQAIVKPKLQRTNSCITTNMAATTTIAMDDCVHASFARILQFLSSRQRVLLWLEDLQYADAPSLQVLEYLLLNANENNNNCMVVLSYRDEEVTPEHATMQLLRKIYHGHDIALQDLPLDKVNEFVAKVTRHSPEETLPLSQVIFQKTAGNPFFVSQFLLMLRREQFLTYSYHTFQWEWNNDVETLAQAAKLSDNVADMIADTMKSLPEATRIAIKVASCLGKIVPLDVLVEYFEGTSNQSLTCQALFKVQETGLRNVLESAVQCGILMKPPGQDAYIWAHDKLQHVAYSLIPNEFRGSLHIKLGKLLWRLSLERDDAEWMVFMAADQLNRYSEYQQQEQDQMGLGAEVASLCLEAAKLSLSKSALIPALEMLQAGLGHLPSQHERWTFHYALTLELTNSVAELAYQLGHKDEAMTAVEQVLEHAKTLDDKFHAQCVMLKAITSGKDRNYVAGTAKTLEILREYGVRFPSKLLPGQAFVEHQKLKHKLPGGSVASLLQFPELTNQRSRNILRLLVQYFGVFNFMAQNSNDSSTSKDSTRPNKDMSWYSVIRALSLSAEQQGVTEDTALAIVGWASHLCEQGQYQEADEYAEMALQLMERFPRSVGSLHANVMAMATGFIFSRSRPLNKSLDYWLEAHHVGLQTGNTEKATAATLGYSYTYLTVGLPLGTLKSDLLAYEKEARQFRMPETVGIVFKIFHQFILNLEQEHVARPAVLKGDAMDEDEILRTLSGSGLRMTKRDIHSMRLLLAVLFGYWEMAEILVDSLEPFLTVDGFVARAGLRRATMALACFKLYRLKGKKKHKTMAKKILKDLEKDLKNGNINSHPIYLMLLAEESPSKDKYDIGIRACARLGLVHFEAYLCERAAEFFLEQKDDGWAEYYMGQAFLLYEDWGAHGKANRMKEEHAGLLKSSSLREKATTALQGRARYSSEHIDILKDFNWERLSSMHNSSSAMGSSSELYLKRSSASTVTSGSEESNSTTDLTTSETSEILPGGFFAMADPMS